ncbi:MAG: cation:proton antiporter [Bacteroidota bacterium]
MLDFFQQLSKEFTLPLQSPVLVFSLILIIILFTPIILKKINIPAIVGLIIAGVIIGPYGFHVLDKNNAIDLFSTIGLLYIMFIAGLDLDLAQFKSYKYKSLLFGFFTFIFPLSIGFPICHYLLDFSFNASLLTASMFSTHTLVSYPIVSQFGITKNQAVAITIGGTILTDTAVLLILAIVLNKNIGELNQAFWIRITMSLVLFVSIMFFVIPRIARWFFQKLESEKHSHYIFVLSVVFFAAFLSQVAGLEPIIGAFAAGLALNKLIPQSSALMNRIEFIGNALFIPFFLISVGMIVDVSVVFNGPYAVMIALVLSSIALIGKWLAAFFTQIIFRYSRNQRMLIFGLSSSHAAATLAVILVGYKAQILDINVLNGTIILILITCIVSSFATHQATKKIVLNMDREEEFEKPESINNEHLLLPFSYSKNFDKLLDFALLLKEKSSSNPVSILSIVPNDEESEKNILKARQSFDNIISQASASEIKVNFLATIDHNPVGGIVRTSREIMSDIILLDWMEKLGLIDFLLGEKISAILKSSDKAIFLCKIEKPLISQKRIVLLVPKFSEMEEGFAQIILKSMKLASELSIPILIFCDEKTRTAIKIITSKYKVHATIKYDHFEDWNDFLILTKYIDEKDLLILFSSRRGTISYFSQIENIPSKIKKYYPNQNFVICFPKQTIQNDIKQMGNVDISTPGVINTGIETIQKIGKGIGDLLKL